MATKVHHPSSYGVWHMGTGILRPYQAFPVVCIYRIMIQRFNICYIETTAMVHHLPIHSYGILMNHLFGHQLIMVHQQHQGCTTAAPSTRVSSEEPTACTPGVARVDNIILPNTLLGASSLSNNITNNTITPSICAAILARPIGPEAAPRSSSDLPPRTGRERRWGWTRYSS